MKRFMIACVAVAASRCTCVCCGTGLVLWVYKDNTDYASIENTVGELSARIIQNGHISVSGNCDCVH